MSNSFKVKVVFCEYNRFLTMITNNIYIMNLFYLKNIIFHNIFCIFYRFRMGMDHFFQLYLL